MQALAFRPPGAQRIAVVRVFNLDDIGAMIRQLQADHIAGNQAGQVDHPDAVQRRLGGRIEFYVWNHSRSLCGHGWPV